MRNIHRYRNGLVFLNANRKNVIFTVDQIRIQTLRLSYHHCSIDQRAGLRKMYHLFRLNGFDRLSVPNGIDKAIFARLNLTHIQERKNQALHVQQVILRILPGRVGAGHVVAAFFPITVPQIPCFATGFAAFRRCCF